ncbi:MAG: GW dipeptide domain-containing protein [Prolixibacteraceae bacterium]|jgi:hypothetical protein|nr:GW dipeptide domain-containing protein [Prolixibacteraceae bacterium]
MRLSIFISVFFLLITSCSQKPKVEKEVNSNEFAMHKVLIEDVIQTSNYTYLKVKENSDAFWIAVMKDSFQEGMELFYFQNKVTVMQNFHSEELNRNFDKILFISQVSVGEGTAAVVKQPGTIVSKAHSGRKQSDVEKSIRIEKAEGGITIAELYSNPLEFKNKTVRIKGEVVKVNNQIMGRNWIHIQDGTKSGKEFDLTITSNEVVELNELITFEGVVGLDKDFTSGYFNPVILEEALGVK